MFTIVNHQENANQNDIEIRSSNKNDCHQENKQLLMRMWEQGLWREAAGGNVNY